MPPGASGHYGPAEAYVDGELIANWVDSFSWVGHDWLGTKRYESGGYGSGTGAYPIFGHETPACPLAMRPSLLPPPTTIRCLLHRQGEGRRDWDDYFGARYYASSMGRFSSPRLGSEGERVPYATSR